MSSGNILMQHSTTSKSGQLMYQNAPTKWLLNRHFYIKTRKSCQTCIWKEKSSPTFYIKNAKFIFSYKPETSQQEEKEKEKKERKIRGKILTYLVLNFSLWKGCKKKKKKPNHTVSKNPVSNHWQHICGNHGLWRIIKSWFCLACLNNNSIKLELPLH